MSIKKIDDLNFERCFPAANCMNDYHDIEFTDDGIVIDYDTLDWDDVKTAYRKLHDKELDV